VDAGAAGGATETFPALSERKHYDISDGRIRVLGLNPAFDDAVNVTPTIHESVQTPFDAFRAQAANDPLGVLYRKAPLAFARDWLATSGKQIAARVNEQFGSAGPKYVVNSGIGANEMFNYFVASLANDRNGNVPQWHLVNSPREMANLPKDASVANTLFMFVIGLLVGQVLVEIAFVFAFDRDLAEHRKRHAIVLAAELLNLFVAAGLLAQKVVGRKAQYFKTLIVVLVVELLQFVVLRR